MKFVIIRTINEKPFYYGFESRPDRGDLSSGEFKEFILKKNSDTRTPQSGIKRVIILSINDCV